MRLRPAVVVVRPRVDEGHLERRLLGFRRATAGERERPIAASTSTSPPSTDSPSHLLLLSSLPSDRATIRQRSFVRHAQIPEVGCFAAETSLRATRMALRSDQWRGCNAVLPSPGETSPPISSCAADASSRSSRASGWRPTSPWSTASIAGLGDYEGRESLDASGKYVVPGFIDAHMHLETVKLMVDEFARLVLPLGTTAVVADPHEIANVLGVDGVHWLLDATSGLQLDVFFMASSCVPASPFESPRRAARRPAISSRSCAGGACSGSRR